MAREKEGYRDNLERINAAFPDRELLRKGDIVKFEGSSYKTVKKRYRFNQFGEISKADYARQVSV